MRYTTAIILFIIALSNAFAQERVIDTVYTDTHKVTYVTNSSSSNEWGTKPSSPPPDYYSSIPSTSTPEDSLGMSAPPNKFSRTSLLLIAQSLTFSINYEHLISDFWSLSLRFGYAGFSEKNIKSYTDAEGKIYSFEAPVSLRWYWGRRNMGKYHYIDSEGNNVYKSSSQVEGYIQAQLAPVFYNVNLHRDSSEYKNKLILKETENALYYTVGFGFNFCYEHFFFGTEINVGTFIKNPKFQDQVKVYNKEYGTRLLDKYVIESILAVGWMF